MPDDKSRETLLAERATKTADDMRRRMAGKPAEQPISTNAESIGAIAALLSAVSTTVTEQRDQLERSRKAMRRIADLEVRGAAQLIEQQQWKRLVAELQAIAQETIGQARP